MAILPTPCCRRCEESIYEYKYLREFEAKNAKTSTRVLGIFSDPINTEKFKNWSCYFQLDVYLKLLMLIKN